MELTNKQKLNALLNDMDYCEHYNYYEDIMKALEVLEILKAMCTSEDSYVVLNENGFLVDGFSCLNEEQNKLIKEWLENESEIN